MENVLAQLDAGSVHHESQLELLRWTVGAGLVVGVGLTVALLYAVWWMYRHEGRGNLSRRSRIGLALLRCAVLALLGVIGLEPVLARYLHRRIEATTLVLLDDSASMGVRDHYRQPEDRQRVEKAAGAVPDEGLARADLTHKLVTDQDHKLLRQLAKDNRVKVFRFSDDAAPLGLLDSAASQPADAVPPAPPSIEFTAMGAATDLGRSLRQAVESLGGSPVAGVVVLSDGGLNYGESPDVIARYLESRRIPLFAVGVGDPAELVNVRVTEVTGPRNAFAKDPFTVSVQVAAEGIEDQPVTVELLRRVPGSSLDSARTIERRTVRPDAEGNFELLKFETRVDEAGPQIFAARIASLPFEAVESDNVRETTPPIQVLDSKMRVLVVAGATTYDYRFLTRMLERDATVDVSCWLQSADSRAVRDGDTVIDHLPATTEELFQYDVVILIDPDPSQLDAEWAGHVASLVDDYGGGLLYAADVKWTTHFLRDPKMRPIVDLLPIVPDPEAELILNQLGHFQRNPWPLVVPPDAAPSALLRQAETTLITAQVWAALEGVYWHYPVRREKPAASVLLRHGNPRMVGATGPHVLYATQFVGAGRTAFLAFNSTWRWLAQGDVYFERFWIQAIRYLMEGKLMGGKKRGSILTERDQYSVGDTIVVTLRALNEKFDPMLVSSLELNVAQDADGGRRMTMTPIPGRDGFYQGRFVADRIGTLHLWAALPSRSGAPETIMSDIVINQGDLELRRPVMRRDVLTRLAQAAGGEYLEVDQAGSIPGRIEDCSLSYVVKERPIPLWDNAYALAALVGLLTIEWIWRKRAKLL